VLEGFGGELAAAGGAVQVAGLEEEGFVHVFERGFFFAHGGGQGLGADRAAVEFFEDGQEDFAVHFVEPRFVHAQPVQAFLRHFLRDDALGLDVGEVPDAPDEPVGDAWRPSRAPADFRGGAGFDGHVQQPCRPVDDGFQFFRGIEVQPVHQPEAFTERGGERAGPGRGSHQGERRQIQFHGAGGRALADDEVDLEILHGGVQGFFHGRGQAVDFVDEQDVVGLQVREDRGEVAGVVQDEPGGRADAAAHFPGDDVRDGGLAQAGRAVEDGVVQGFVAALRGLDADPQRFFHALLAGVVLQGLRAQGAFGVLFFFQEVVGDDAVFHEGIARTWDGTYSLPSTSLRYAQDDRRGRRNGGEAEGPALSFLRLRSRYAQDERGETEERGVIIRSP